MSHSCPTRSRFEKWTDTPHLVIYMGVLAVLTILALVLGLVAQSKASDEQSQRTKQLQGAICDTFRDVSKSPLTAKTTELGRRLVQDTRRGADAAKCPQ